MSLKKGKFIKKLYGNFSKSFSSSEIGKKQAIARKYQGYLSRRKYDFLGKINSATYDPSNQTWNKKMVCYGEHKFRLHEVNISN